MAPIPAFDMPRMREKITLAVVARRVRQHEVVTEIDRIARPSDEMIDVAAASYRATTVEAPGMLMRRIGRKPGTRFWYSDAGANALGAVVQVVEGRPLGEVLTDRLLDPLGMNDSFVEMSADDPRWARVASLYAKVGGAWILAWTPRGASLYPFAWGSQGVYATPADYATFTALLLHGGYHDGRRLLSERAVRSMVQPVSRLTAMGSEVPAPTHFSGLEARYGRMVEVHAPQGDSARAVIVGHSGSDGTIIWAWPDRDLVVAYFTQSRGNATYLRLERVIDQVLLHANRRAPAVEAGASALVGCERPPLPERLSPIHRR